ncbi:hypothetical protein MSPP1_002210 [Malassezia sp. CBS 17886]|nr:hypothetical protein MSPP1_002210 [Malassezia sp. CBS 17886]
MWCARIGTGVRAGVAVVASRLAPPHAPVPPGSPLRLLRSFTSDAIRTRGDIQVSLASASPRNARDAWSGSGDVAAGAHAAGGRSGAGREGATAIPPRPSATPASAPPASDEALWIPSFSARDLDVFLRHAVSMVDAARVEITPRALHDIVREAFPDAAQLQRSSGAAMRRRREELQCVLLSALLRRGHDAMAPVADLWYPGGRFSHALHWVCPGRENRALRQLQRALLVRYFMALLDAGRFRDAACIVCDERLHASQPNLLIRVLLDRMHRMREHAQRTRSGREQSANPSQSVHAALRTVCRAFVGRQQRRGRLSAFVFNRMLITLAARRMHNELLLWTHHVVGIRGMRHIVRDAPDVPLLERVVQRLCMEQGAYAEATSFVFALPVAWRSRIMYNLLLAHHGGAPLAADGALADAVDSPATLAQTLWHDLCVYPHLLGPDMYSYLARLQSHARDGRAAHALHDMRLLLATEPAAPTPSVARLLAVKALVRSGRLRLALRLALRMGRPVPRDLGAVLLKTLLFSILAGMHNDPHAESAVLRTLYQGVLRAATDAYNGDMRHGRAQQGRLHTGDEQAAPAAPYALLRRFAAVVQQLDLGTDAASLCEAVFAHEHTHFKVRLRVPSAGGGAAGSVPATNGAAAPESETVAEAPAPESEPAAVAPAPESEGAAPESGDDRISEEDELSDELLESAAAQLDDATLASTEAEHGDSTERNAGVAARKQAKLRRTSGTLPSSIGAVAASLTLEEIDALPSAKRRKSLKTRGAPGPGRGWRKGLSKGQKPVYRLPGADVSAAELENNPGYLPVASSTPSSFARESSGDASPPGGAPKSKSKSGGASASGKGSGAAAIARSSASRTAHSAADHAFRYPSIPTRADAPEILPLPRIPNVIPTVGPVDRSAWGQKARHWYHGEREILTLGGRTWRTPGWFSTEAPRSEPASL